MSLCETSVVEDGLAALQWLHTWVYKHLIFPAFFLNWFSNFIRQDCVFNIYITLVGSGKEKAAGLGSQYGWCYRLSGERKLQGLIGRILLEQHCLNSTADVVHAPKLCLSSRC